MNILNAFRRISMFVVKSQGSTLGRRWKLPNTKMKYDRVMWNLYLVLLRVNLNVIYFVHFLFLFTVKTKNAFENTFVLIYERKHFLKEAEN